LQAVVWVGVGTQWLVAAVSQFLSLALPYRHAFVSNAGCGFLVVTPLRFPMAFPAILGETSVVFVFVCARSRWFVCTISAQQKKERGETTDFSACKKQDLSPASDPHCPKDTPFLCVLGYLYIY